jgi:tRNA uridine 5-carbamoylmethylation protein Kti12
MKLILIYAPPASGKLTVANQLSKLTGFKVFHSHIINDMLDEFLNSETSYYWKVNTDLKLKIIDALSKSKLKGLILTTVYIGKKDIFRLAKKIKNIVIKNKGDFYSVRLETDKSTILKRVTNKSRKSYGKISSKKELINYINKYGLNNILPFKNQFTINNTKTSAKEVAKQIKEHYHL